MIIPADDKIRELFDAFEQKQSVSAYFAHYRLDEHRNVVPCSMHEAFVSSFDEETRIVRKTKLGRNSHVSTVFLGGFMVSKMRQSLRLFETMVFGGHHDGLTRQYETWDEAERGHEEVVRLCRAGVVTKPRRARKGS